MSEQLSFSEEAEWTQKLQQGDKQAFQKIFDKEKQKCISIAYSILWPDHEEAQDIAQYGFIKLWEHRDNMDVARGYRSWLYRCVKNRAIDIFKMKKNRSRILQNQLQYKMDTEIKTDENYIIREEMQMLMSKLSQKHQSVIFLKYWGQFSIDEIAQILEIPSGTVRSRLFEAQQKIKQSYNDS